MSEPDPEVEEETEGEAEAPTDNVGDISVEVNVEDLIAEIESEGKDGASCANARRRIEDILEEKRIARDIMDIEDYDIEE
jgi:hypothetical protein